MAFVNVAIWMAYAAIAADAQNWCSYYSNKCGTLNTTPTDLSCGVCRSWTYFADIAGDELRALGLDGGATAADGNANNSYMVSASLREDFDLTDGSNWKLTLLNASVVPESKDGALWSSSDNQTIFAFGGRVPAPSRPPSGYSLPMLDTSSDQWNVSMGEVAITRLARGVSVNVPELDMAYYVGGYQGSDTSTNAPQDGLSHFAQTMIAFNTSSQTPSTLNAPFLPVQHGAVFYVPVGSGLLIYLGGETPAQTAMAEDSDNFKSNTWDSVWIYDIKGDKWYEQLTTNAPSPRSELCGAILYDDDTRSWQIWLIGGADFETKDVLDTVSVLSIPSFEWFIAESATTRMSTACVNVGPQVFVIGGRNNDSDIGGTDYDALAFIYDANQQQTAASFTSTYTSYQAPSTIRDAVSSSPTPKSWADPALQQMFVASSTSSTRPSSSPSSPSSTSAPDNKHSLSGGAIAGIVIGVIVLLVILVALVFFCLRKRQQTRYELDSSNRRAQDISELAEVSAKERRYEVEAERPPAELS